MTSSTKDDGGFESLAQKVGQLEDFFDYMAVDALKRDEEPACGAERVSHAWFNWFGGAGMLVIMTGHPYPVTSLSAFERIPASPARDAFLDVWAGEHPLVKVDRHEPAVQLSAMVKPDATWDARTWHDCLLDLWFQRQEFLDDLQRAGIQSPR